MQRSCAAMCAIHRFEPRVDGQLPDGPAVFVANHLSYVDPIALCGIIPSAPVAKSEVADWPVFGAGARSLGVLFVKRGDAFSGARALRGGLRALADGVSVLGFPEGTTTHGDQLLPFARGLFGIARIAGVPIVPVAIGYDDPTTAWVGDDWFVPHYLRTAARERTTVTVRVGVPIVARGRAEELAAQARDAIAGLCWGQLRAA
jgi:1-acyl-sn-glycerol-3-phosphate acyltransferase